MVTLKINGSEHTLDVPDNMPLLWALRDHLKMTGTKFGCGRSLCGACTVHLDGQAVRSCTTPVSSAAGSEVTTIEAMAEDPVGRRVQAAWLDQGVAQCGYCQGGQVMSATALLKSNDSPSDEQIESAMNGNLCRCGTYNRVRSAIRQVAGDGEGES